MLLGRLGGSSGEVEAASVCVAHHSAPTPCADPQQQIKACPVGCPGQPSGSAGQIPKLTGMRFPGPGFVLQRLPGSVLECPCWCLSHRRRTCFISRPLCLRQKKHSGCGSEGQHGLTFIYLCPCGLPYSVKVLSHFARRR